MLESTAIVNKLKFYMNVEFELVHSSYTFQHNLMQGECVEFAVDPVT
jgi:hypothetical protein